MTLVLIVVVLLLITGATLPDEKRCDCERCWYVNVPPAGAPICMKKFMDHPELKDKNWVALALGGLALLGYLMLRKKRGEGSSGWESCDR